MKWFNMFTLSDIFFNVDKHSLTWENLLFLQWNEDYFYYPLLLLFAYFWSRRNIYIYSSEVQANIKGVWRCTSKVSLHKDFN